MEDVGKRVKLEREINIWVGGAKEGRTKNRYFIHPTLYDKLPESGTFDMGEKRTT